MAIYTTPSPSDLAPGCDTYKAVIDHLTAQLESRSKMNEVYYNRAQAHFGDGNYEAALKDLQEYVALRPLHLQGHILMAQTTFALGKCVEGLRAHRRALLISSKDPLLQEEHDNLQRRRIQFNLDRALAVQASKEDCSSEYETAARAALTEASTAFMSLETTPVDDPAVLEALKSITEDVDDPELSLYMLRLTGDELTTARKLKNETTSDKDLEQNADLWKNKGNSYYTKRQFLQALVAYDMAILLYPRNATYATNKSAVFLEMGYFHECIQTCDQILAQRYEWRTPYEKVAKMFVRMATAYSRIFLFDSAIEMLEKALTEDNQKAYRMQLNEVRLAKKKFESEQEIDVERAEQLRLEGNELFKQEKYDRALAVYNEAVRKNPNDARILANRASTEMKLEKYSEAIKDLEAALELDPKNAKYWARKAKCHHMNKDYSRAIAAYQEGLKHDANDMTCSLGIRQLMHELEFSRTSMDSE